MTRVSTPALIELLRVCWHQDPFQRPPFSQIAADLKKLRIMAGADAEESPNPVTSEIKQDVLVTKPSPDMHPTGLPESPCECFHDLCLGA
jgi:abelson tyrosine-protein kinase 1